MNQNEAASNSEISFMPSLFMGVNNEDESLERIPAGATAPLLQIGQELVTDTPICSSVVIEALPPHQSIIQRSDSFSTNSISLEEAADGVESVAWYSPLPAVKPPLKRMGDFFTPNLKSLEPRAINNRWERMHSGSLYESELATTRPLDDEEDLKRVRETMETFAPPMKDEMSLSEDKSQTIHTLSNLKQTLEICVASFESEMRSSGVERKQPDEKQKSTCCRKWSPLECTCGTIFCTLLVFVIASLTAAVIFLGSLVEGVMVATSSPMRDVFNLSDNEIMCAVRVDLTQKIFFDFKTVSNVKEAHTLSRNVAHCGDCGACSTMHDMQIMADTQLSLTDDVIDCAKKVFLGGRKIGKSCLEENVGFTNSCNDCWVNSVMCTIVNCKFTCTKDFLLNFKGIINQDDAMKACLQCNNHMCGSALLQCAGSSPQRIGIAGRNTSRSNDQNCPYVDVLW